MTASNFLEHDDLVVLGNRLFCKREDLRDLSYQLSMVLVVAREMLTAQASTDCPAGDHTRRAATRDLRPRANS